LVAEEVVRRPRSVVVGEVGVRLVALVPLNPPLKKAARLVADVNTAQACCHLPLVQAPVEDDAVLTVPATEAAAWTVVPAVASWSAQYVWAAVVPTDTSVWAMTVVGLNQHASVNGTAETTALAFSRY
jgi:hypothetical protein